MKVEKQWTDEVLKNGIYRITCHSWSGVLKYFSDKNFDLHGFVWRGHADERWKLQPSLYRCQNTSKALNEYGANGSTANLLQAHCSIPKQSLRHAFALRASSRELIKDDEQMWAYAQHHGARAPLLDWTRSPMVAVFFALAQYVESLDSEANDFAQGNIVIWGLWDVVIDSVVYAYNLKTVKVSSLPTAEFSLVESHFPGNSRIVAQQGVFTYFNLETPLEKFVKSNAGDPVGPESTDPSLIRVEIPKTETIRALTSLNRMGINYRTLYPDIEGACRHANLDALLPNYQGMIPRRDPTITNLGDSLKFLEYEETV